MRLNEFTERVLLYRVGDSPYADEAHDRVLLPRFRLVFERVHVDVIGAVTRSVHNEMAGSEGLVPVPVPICASS